MSLAVIVVLSFLVISLVVGLYQKSTNGICKSKKRLDGKTVIVTGGTLGIGLQTATDLADRGARLIVACPFEQEGQAALRAIIENTGYKNVAYKHLDLASFESVRKFAGDILKTEDRLDILINNAGVAGFPKGKFMTADGLDFVMQVNYLGHVLLTLLLLPLLKKTGTPQQPSRIVNTSSLAHRFAIFGVLDVSKVNKLLGVSYMNSKLCLIVFSFELTNKLLGSNVVINSVEPGLVATGIYKALGSIPGYLLQVILRIFFKTAWEGAQTILHVALDEKAGQVSGALFRDCEQCKPFFWRSPKQMQKMLWENSIRLIEIKDEEFKCSLA